MRKLYVIDGLDGCGKSTQAELTVNKLTDLGYKARLVSFPDYKEPSSALVRMYLNGEFGKNADDVGAYAASAFYAVDRYASFKKHWRGDYESGTIIIASRYVSSNILHQMGKLPDGEWSGFIDWLDDFEHVKMQLPRPDRIFYLDMPRSVADALILSRYGGDEEKKDIHEANTAYLLRCEQASAYSADKQGWEVVSCSDGEKPLDKETINSEILNRILIDLKGIE